MVEAEAETNEQEMRLMEARLDGGWQGALGHMSNEAELTRVTLRRMKKDKAARNQDGQLEDRIS